MPINPFILIAPELVLILGGLVLLMVAAFAGDRLAVLVNALAAVVLAAGIIAVASLTGVDTLAFGSVRIDAFGSFAKYLVFAAGIVALIMAPRFFERQGYRAEYPVLIVFASLGMSIMVSAFDLIALYIGLELLSLSSYVLASFMRSDTRSSEAGLKYFVLGALASGMLLYGLSLLYGFTGSLSFSAIAAAFTDVGNPGLLFGLVFTVSGLAFKISAVPFHMWTPDVYEGAPTPVTAFFASAPKVAALALLMRVCFEAMPQAAEAWRQIVAFMAIASMLLGSVGAVGQRSIKRLLAYSSIANVGFILIGLAAGSSAGVAAMLFYLVVYVVMTLGAFMAVLQLRTVDGGMIDDLAGLSGLWRARPWLAAGIAIFMFSLAGIPPLFGFWPKLLVFQAAINAGQLPLAIVGAIASTISAFYYLRVIKLMLFDAPAGPAVTAGGPAAERALIAIGAAYVSLIGFLLIAPLDRATAIAAGSLF